MSFEIDTDEREREREREMIKSAPFYFGFGCKEITMIVEASAATVTAGAIVVLLVAICCRRCFRARAARREVQTDHMYDML